MPCPYWDPDTIVGVCGMNLLHFADEGKDMQGGVDSGTTELQGQVCN
jgi:hypothetical protein